MKIEGLNNINFTNPNTKVNINNQVNKTADFKEIISIKDPSQKGISIPNVVNKEYIQNFAEWYFKLGKSYESSKDYKQALSAYERSYSVSPDISKAKSVDELKSKISKED